MSITFKNNTFYLESKNSSYIFQIAKDNVLEHIYYGKKIPKENLKSILNRQIYSFAPMSDQDRTFAKSTIMQEVSIFNSGDFRQCSIILDGHVDTNFSYVSHQIYKGRKEIPGLPYSRENSSCETLEILLSNDKKDIEITLYYILYKDVDVIARYQKIKNLTSNKIGLLRFMSLNLDFDNMNYDYLTTNGMYLYECGSVDHFPLHKGIQSNSSNVGSSSHHVNPFFALVSKEADECNGDVFGFNLIYSGNFKNSVEVDRLENTRIMVGINDEGFNFVINPKEEFYSPEAIMTFSSFGLSKMSQNFHDHVRNNIIEKSLAYKKHPIVLNSWEGFYFDVNEEIVNNLASKALKIGADTVVIDDGWFRNNASSGLGDWEVIKEKFPSTLKELSKKIHSKGLNFGIWIEPEMVSLDTKLYKENKNIVVSINKRPLIGRNQFCIDLTKDEYIDKVLVNLKRSLGDVQIDYIKIDYNRYLCDANCLSCPAGEVYHRQILGTYKLISNIKEMFPDAFIETCSGGGGRFDLGMLYYSPMIWTSDNTDPYNRIFIQNGTSYGYPQSAMSCHFTKGECITKRESSPDFRYLVASFGSYGYELDLSKSDEYELKQLKEFSKKYRKDEKFMQNSDLFRLISPQTNQFVAYINVAKNKSKAIFNFLIFAKTGFYESFIIKLNGLDPKKKYKNSYNDEIHSGNVYMNAGIRLNNLFKTNIGDGIRIYFDEVKK